MAIVATGSTCNVFLLDPGPSPTYTAGDFRYHRDTVGLQVQQYHGLSGWLTKLEVETTTGTGRTKSFVDVDMAYTISFERVATLTDAGGALQVDVLGPMGNIDANGIELFPNGIASGSTAAVDAIHWQVFTGTLPGTGLLQIVPDFPGILGAVFALQVSGSEYDVVGYRNDTPDGFYARISVVDAAIEVTFDLSRYASGNTWRAVVFSSGF